MTEYPRVAIKFCTKCKWNLRAAWYLQELLSTYGEKLGEVALIPFEAGVFRVEVQGTSETEAQVIWDRKTQGGFPDSKILKQLVRDALFPEEQLGHLDKQNQNEGKLITEKTQNETTECVECIDGAQSSQ